MSSSAAWMVVAKVDSKAVTRAGRLVELLAAEWVVRLVVWLVDE